MQRYDVIILGAGAAGLMCAITAGQRGRKVLVLERANKVGKKILMSGGGRCNFTNQDIQASNFLSANPHFCKSALHQYTQWDFIELINKHAIAYHEKTHGQLFCDGSSKEILSMLLLECDRAGVEIRTRYEVEKVECDHGFLLETSHGKLKASSLVVATGGLSIPKLGGSGFGYELARQYGMNVLPGRAGLVPLTFAGELNKLFSRLSGLSVAVRVTTGKQSFAENMLFTHRGLSGPAILQLSSYWREGQSIGIDLLPETDASMLLRNFKRQQPKALLRTLLTAHLPKKLVTELELLWWPDYADKAIAEIPNNALAGIAEQLHNWRLKPSGIEGYRTAEVTLGGVDTSDLSSKTMQSKTRPKLYFIGEVVDVTGQLGGYNFQWAWSSAYVAGLSV